MSYLLITAKFAGKCPECGHRIERDTWIKYDPVMRTAKHKKCPVDKKEGKNG